MRPAPDTPDAQQGAAARLGSRTCGTREGAQRGQLAGGRGAGAAGVRGRAPAAPIRGAGPRGRSPAPAQRSGGVGGPESAQGVGQGARPIAGRRGAGRAGPAADWSSVVLRHSGAGPRGGPSRCGVGRGPGVRDPVAAASHARVSGRGARGGRGRPGERAGVVSSQKPGARV